MDHLLSVYILHANIIEFPTAVLADPIKGQEAVEGPGFLLETDGWTSFGKSHWSEVSISREKKNGFFIENCWSESQIIQFGRIPENSSESS